MLEIDIYGVKLIRIEHVVLDFNGTIAVNGHLIKGVKEKINQFSESLAFHVITADTFGGVQKELDGVHCRLTVIPEQDQAQHKLDYLSLLGSEKTIGVGNGANDALMLEKASLGIAVLHNEGLATKTLLASDLVISNILDLFEFFNNPDRLVATLRQ